MIRELMLTMINCIACCSFVRVGRQAEGTRESRRLRWQLARSEQ